MKRLLLLVGLVAISGVTQAAKVHVELTTPTMNEAWTDKDGVLHPESPLTDLTTIVVEWGTCNGVEFGLRQSAISISTNQTGVRLRSAIYPTGLNRVCARAFAINSQGAMSRSSNVAWKDLIGKPGQPVRLGDVLEITFTTKEIDNG